MTADRTISHDIRLGNDASSSTQNAALRGAALAFGKPPVKPKPQIQNYSGNNAALAAATKAGTGSPSHTLLEVPGDDGRLSYQSTGSSAGGAPYAGLLEQNTIQKKLNQLNAGNGFLRLPGASKDSSKSPSLIAASLAASRSASVSPNHTGRQQPSAAGLRRPSSFIARSPSVRSLASSGESNSHALDTTSIPPTTSLIGMFEQNNGSPQAGKKAAVRRSATSAARNPSPGVRRPASPLSVGAGSPSPPARIGRPEIKSPGPSLEQVQRNPKQADPPKPPPKAQKPPIPAAKPIPTPTNPKLQYDKVEKDEDASSDDSFVSASDYQPSFRAALSSQKRLASPSTASLNSSVAVDALANAIVASSLASTRAASPSRNQQSRPPPPQPRRNGRGHGHLFHNGKDESRTPSPAKQGMRTTMRKPRSKEEVNEGEKRRAKKNLVKKHPNKHHEGDRKRWRDSITERERKRYEAVWASNKGLYVSNSEGPGAENTVCNLVAREIFSRSRLHTDVLEEVYSLIDRSEVGRLEREEFVVGLWLIDQRLKGRKLPIRVSDSVWRSVGGLGGIKIRGKGK